MLCWHIWWSSEGVRASASIVQSSRYFLEYYKHHSLTIRRSCICTRSHFWKKSIGRKDEKDIINQTKFQAFFVTGTYKTIRPRHWSVGPRCRSVCNYSRNKSKPAAFPEDSTTGRHPPLRKLLCNVHLVHLSFSSNAMFLSEGMFLSSNTHAYLNMIGRALFLERCSHLMLLWPVLYFCLLT